MRNSYNFPNIRRSMKLQECFSLITKNGLRTQKFKNSHLQLISSAEEGRRGSVFAYRSKANMVKARGVVLTSIESLLENQDQFTHWTPNVYCYGSYSDAGRRITRGHSEDNLRQINTFYIDFDITSSAEEMSCRWLFLNFCVLNPSFVMMDKHFNKSIFFMIFRSLVSLH